MNCPYCAEPVNHGATVCKTCQRDISLASSLKEANSVLELKVNELEAELAELRERAAPEAVPPGPEPSAQPLNVLDLVVVYLVLPTIVLVGTHYLLVMKLDAKLAWLRAASIVLPAVFGWMLESRLKPRWFVTAGLGIVVGFASVFGMSTMVHFVDGEPILPKGGFAWQETIEYITSIALAYVVGSLIAFSVRPSRPTAKRGRDSRFTKLATFIALHLSGKNQGKPLEERIQRVVKLLSLVASASTALGAVYTGFKGIL